MGLEAGLGSWYSWLSLNVVAVLALTGVFLLLSPVQQS